jgi:hypothetical protein
MPILILAAILLLSAILSIGSLQPVLASFALFVALFLVFLMGCMLPGCIRIRGHIFDRRFYRGIHGSAKTAYAKRTRILASQ